MTEPHPLGRVAPAAPRVLALAPGDPLAPSTWSGSSASLFGAFRDAGQLGGAVDISLPRLVELAARAVTVAPDLQLWRERSSLGRMRAFVGGQLAQRRILGSDDSADFVLQVGSWIRPPRFEGPRAVYLDSAFAQLLARPRSAIKRDSSFARWRMQFERSVYHDIDVVFTFSEWTRASIIADFGVPEGKVVVARPGPNGVPPSEPVDRPITPGPRILFVGKKWERKGGPTLLAAFSQLRKQVPTAELWVVGPTEPLAAADGVRIWGRLNRAEPAQSALFEHLMATADCFAMPSRYEPFGMVFVEAMHRGLPCIGTRQCAMPEIIVDGETGWLVPDADADALADVLAQMAKDPGRTRAMGEAARLRAAREYTWAQCIATMSAAIEDL